VSDRGFRDAIRIAVKPGPLAQPALARVLAVGASRAQLSLTGVDRVTEAAGHLARVDEGQLLAGRRLELVVLGTPGRLEISAGVFERDVAETIIAGDGSGSLTDLVTTVVPVRAWDGERIAIEVVEVHQALSQDGRPSPDDPIIPPASIITGPIDDASIAVVAVAGEIDVHTAPELRLTARNTVLTYTNAMVLDLREATFVDSTGIAALIGLVQLVQPDGKVAIVNTNPAIARALALTGLEDIFSVWDTVSEATQHLRDEGYGGRLKQYAPPSDPSSDS